MAPVRAAPAPVLNPLRQARPHRVSLDIPQHREQVLVALHRKRFESALIQMARSAGVIVGMPPHRVRHRQPLQEFGHLRVGLRPHDQMPMVRHQRISENPQRNSLASFFEHPFERFVVRILLKNRQPSHRTIEAVEHHSGRTNAFGSRHPGSLTDWRCPEKSPDPFSHPCPCRLD